MRTVFVFFRTAARAEVAAHLDARYTRRPDLGDWVNADGALFIHFDDDAATEREPEHLASLRRALGREEIVEVAADISGRIPGTDEALGFCTDLLAHFDGFAQDDHTDHGWTLDELRGGHLHRGHPFFDAQGWWDEEQRNLERGRRYGFTEKWHQLRLLDADVLDRLDAAWAIGDDPHPEHYRWRAFVWFLDARPTLPEWLAEELYDLGAADEDQAMGASMMHRIVARPDCPPAVERKARASGERHLIRLLDRRPSGS